METERGKWKMAKKIDMKCIRKKISNTDEVEAKRIQNLLTVKDEQVGKEIYMKSTG